MHIARDPGHVTVNEETGEVTGDGPALIYYRELEKAHPEAKTVVRSPETERTAEEQAALRAFLARSRRATQRYWAAQATAQATALVKVLDSLIPAPSRTV